MAQASALHYIRKLRRKLSVVNRGLGAIFTTLHFLRNLQMAQARALHYIRKL